MLVKRRVAYPADMNTAPAAAFITEGRRRVAYPAVMNTAPGDSDVRTSTCTTYIRVDLAQHCAVHHGRTVVYTRQDKPVVANRFSLEKQSYSHRSIFSNTIIPKLFF